MPSRPIRRLALLGLLLWLPACAGNREGTRGRAPLLVTDSLTFGTQKPKGVVTPEEWEGFLREEVTARFPEGLTVLEGRGQWKGADGKVVREKSKVLLIVHPEGQEAEKSIREIIDLYKKRFNQESVLRVKSRAEVTF